MTKQIFTLYNKANRQRGAHSKPPVFIGMASAAFGAKTTALEVVRGLKVELNGKVVLITGVTSGR